MNNFPGIPNATVYGHAKGTPKTPPQHPVKATVYGHAASNTTVYGRTTGAPKTPSQTHAAKDAPDFNRGRNWRTTWGK